MPPIERIALLMLEKRQTCRHDSIGKSSGNPFSAGLQARMAIK